MRGTIAGFLAGGRQNPGAQSWRQNRGLLAGMISIEPIEPDSRKRCFQRMIVGALVCSRRLMVLKEAPSASIRDELGAKDVTRRQGTRLSDAAEFGMLVVGKRDFAVCRHTNLEA